MGLSMTSRKELARETAPRYRAEKVRKAKKKILDDFVQHTGWNRKYAITVLNSEGKEKLKWIDGKLVKLKVAHKTKQKRKRERYYGDDVAEALTTLWNYFHQMGTERLLPLIRQNIDSLRADDKERFVMSDTVRDKLLKISRPTAERILKPVRQKQKIKGTCSTKHGTLLRNQIPIRVYWPWADQKPGFCEIDTVSHDGGNASGQYCYTLTVTEIAHQWTLDFALLNKAQKWVIESMDSCRISFPVLLKGINADNGEEFINHALKKWCEDNHIDFTRSRPYHKNDNCYVEQKNYDRVRKNVGYARFEGITMRDALAMVYHYLNPLGNYFYPCKKLVDKKRVNNKTIKTYDKLQTPYERIMNDAEVLQQDKDILRQSKADLNILSLQDGVDAAVDRLLKFAYNNAINKS
jgi:hypothetical protein